MKPLPPQELLEEYLSYDPDTGMLTLKKRSGNRIAGTKLGHLRKKGYLRAGFLGTDHMVHRLIWGLVTGSDPGSLEVDHLNEDKSDNRWVNLRLATGGQNRQNISTHRRHKSGIKGVHWLPGVLKWKASVNLGGRIRYLGCFTDAFEAEKVVRAAREADHREFANHGVPPTEAQMKDILAKNRESQAAENKRRSDRGLMC